MSHQELIHFYDSANAANVPSGVHAAIYVNGFKWDKHDIDRMAAIKSVSVERGAEWAKLAAIIDIETNAGDPVDVPPFIAERRKHHDDATAYVNRSNWPLVIEAVHNARMQQPLYWVATLDGTMIVEPIDGISAWAVQYFGGPTTAFDKSILHGRNTFHKP